MPWQPRGLFRFASALARKRPIRLAKTPLRGLMDSMTLFHIVVRSTCSSALGGQGEL